ncbi:MAG: ABC transporter permease, partial [Neobacillus sp.]
MAKYLVQRVLYMIFTLFIVVSITFFLMKLIPGTPFNNWEKLSETQRHILQVKYGFDQPVPVQYVHYIINMVKGDLGVSFQFNNTPVTELLAQRTGPSALLGAQAMIIGALIGIILGVVAALKQNTWIDYGATIIAVMGKSIPNFIFAGLLQYFVAVKLGWLPVMFWNGPSFTILPTIALAMF